MHCFSFNAFSSSFKGQKYIKDVLELQDHEFNSQEAHMKCIA